MTSAREILLASCSWLLLTAAATAADVPVPLAKAPPALASSWAGFYLGLHGGYGWRDSDFSEQISAIPLVRIDGIRSKGGVFGAQAGYNWQFGRAVTGFEFDLSGADIRGSNSASAPFFLGPAVTQTQVRDDKVKYIGTARGRVGWSPTDTILLYGTAGLAWERYDRTNTASLTGVGPPTTSFNRTPFDRFGWVAGAGVEAKLFGPHWIGRIEYLHYDFGRAENSQTFNATGLPAPPTLTIGGNQTIDVVRAAVSYKFGDLAVASTVPYSTKAAIVAPFSSWAGFYLGAHGGYGWKENDFSEIVSDTPFATINGIKSRGWVGGGQAGYNWQYDRLVTGFELDLSASGIKGSSSVSFVDAGTPISFVRSDNVKYLGTLRTRVGWLPVDNVLLYGTAGLAWERVERTNTQAITNPPGTDSTGITNPFDRFGWVAGAGVETLLFGTNWIGRLEYLHYDFGALQTVFSETTAGVTTSNRSGSQTIEVVRAGLSYKFGPPAAAAAVPYTKAPSMALASWAGFYLGVDGGYGWKQNDFATFTGIGGTGVAAGTTIGGINSKGWAAGGHVGYNWQTAKIVAGLEVDVTATGIKGSTPFALVVPGARVFSQTLSDNVTYLGTARARLGWTPVHNILLYGTGGLAWERVARGASTDDTVIPIIAITSTQRTARDHFGWTAGAGAEVMLFGPNWIGRVEYLHYDFGTVETVTRFASTDPAANPPSTSDRGGRQTIDLVRAGVSYKFTP
jgi:outer membrane immunogenic protein